MPRIILTVPPRIEREFKAAAKREWPKETWAFLLGTIVGDRAHVDELYWPEDADEHCTAWRSNPQPHWFADASERAEEIDAAILGSCHSHPYHNDTNCLRERVRSEGDMDYPPVANMIAGICVVQEMKDKRLRASMRFWGPSVAVELRRGD